MKTLPQLLSLRGRTPTPEIFWAHESYFFGGSRGTRVPDGIIKAHNGPYYFIWHEPCYSKINTCYKPAHSPRRRRPRHDKEPREVICLDENFGSYHHRFKKQCSRIVRRALKRELAAGWQEEWEDDLHVQMCRETKQVQREFRAAYEKELAAYATFITLANELV